MAAKLAHICGIFPLLFLAPLAMASQAAVADTPDPALVDRALAAELHSAQDAHHPMRYLLRKSSPRFTTTKEIIETKDGAVARLVAINDRPLSPADELKEQARLSALLSDPGRQRHRKLSEDADTARALKVLRVFPEAFLFQPAGSDSGPAGWKRNASGNTRSTLRARAVSASSLSLRWRWRPGSLKSALRRACSFNSSAGLRGRSLMATRRATAPSFVSMIS